MGEAQTKAETQRRKSVRYDHSVNCDLKSARQTMRATTLNISEGGVCIRLTSFGSIEMDSVVAIQMQDFPLINGKVIWVNNRIIGIAFIDTMTHHREFVELIDSLKG